MKRSLCTIDILMSLIYYICFTLNNQMNVYVVLFGSSVILAAVSYDHDILNFYDVVIAFVYVKMFAQRVANKNS